MGVDNGRPPCIWEFPVDLFERVISKNEPQGSVKLPKLREGEKYSKQREELA